MTVYKYLYIHLNTSTYQVIKIKKLLIILLVLGAVIAGAAIFLAGNLDELIAQAIETEGSEALGTSVSVESVKTDLTAGSASISGLTVANPAGYSKPFALSVGSFSANIDYANQLVEEVVLNNPVINAELKGKSSNFQDLLENMPDSADEEETDTEESDFELTIRRLKISQATVNLLTSDFNPGQEFNLGKDIQLGDHSFVMDDWVMTNLKGTADEVSSEVTRSLVAHITGQVKEYVTAEIKSRVQDQLKDELKKKATEALEEKLGDKLDEGVKEQLGDKLKGLKLKFGK